MAKVCKDKLITISQTSKESKLSCGVGTGAYSSRYAVGFGCASKINERVDVNAGGSYVFGGSKSYGGGTLDSGVVKAVELAMPNPKFFIFDLFVFIWP